MDEKTVIGWFAFRALDENGKAVKVKIECSLFHARWLTNREVVSHGVFETGTNRIYL
jgi:hypothetical protein